MSQLIEKAKNSLKVSVVGHFKDLCQALSRKSPQSLLNNAESTLLAYDL